MARPGFGSGVVAGGRVVVEDIVITTIGCGGGGRVDEVGVLVEVCKFAGLMPVEIDFGMVEVVKVEGSKCVEPNVDIAECVVDLVKGVEVEVV